jgi:cell division protein FtsQ
MNAWGRPRNRRLAGERRLALPAIDWRRLGSVAVAMGIVAGTVLGIRWILDQPIERIAVAGQFQRVTPDEIERAVKTRTRDAGIVSIELEGVRRAIDALPWVDTVSVQRSWPRGLAVSVVEQVPAARWGEHGLLNTRGELFVSEARHIPNELPQLSGPEGSERIVAERYLAARGRLVEAGLRLTGLRLDARGAWEIDLDSGITVRLGRRQVDERFERFMATAAKLIGRRGAEIAYVDMRYTNGFAIGWRAARRAAKGGSRHA